MKRFGKTTKKDKDKNLGTDWIETSVQGGAVLLALVREASQFAPIPGLQQAAGATLQIVRTVQAVKDNKTAFQNLATDATNLIAAVWRSYQGSSNQKDWPPQELKDVISELVVTLTEINTFVNDQLARGKTIRLMFSTADITTIQQYRQKLQSAVSRFEISSHLSINDVLHQVLRKQLEITEHLVQRGITIDLTDAEKILMRTSREVDSEEVHVNYENVRGSSSMSPPNGAHIGDIPRAMVTAPSMDQPRSITVAAGANRMENSERMGTRSLTPVTGEPLRSSPEPMIASPTEYQGDRHMVSTDQNYIDSDREMTSSPTNERPEPESQSTLVNTSSDEDLQEGETDADINAAATRYMTKESAYLSKRNAADIEPTREGTGDTIVNAKRAQAKDNAALTDQFASLSIDSERAPKKRPTSFVTPESKKAKHHPRKATVESDTETAVNESQSSEMDQEEAEAEARLAGIRAAKKKKPRSSTSPRNEGISEEEERRASLARQTLNSNSNPSPPPSQGSSWPSNSTPPPFANPSPQYASPYSPPNPYSPSPYSPYPPSSYPSSPYPPYYHSPPYGGPPPPQMMNMHPSHYGHPGMYGGFPPPPPQPTNNTHSGNSSYINISNVGNDNSRKVIKTRSRKTREE